MASPRVELISLDGLKFVFSYMPSMRFSAAIYSSSGESIFFLSSPVARSCSLTPTSFEIYFAHGVFVFPISELKKFNDFLEVAKSVQEPA